MGFLRIMSHNVWKCDSNRPEWEAKGEDCSAAARAKEIELGQMNLDHIQAYAEELKAAGVEQEGVSPLLLPKYARHER